MAEWTQEQRKAAVSRIARTGKNTDPEAWLADQLAQLTYLHVVPSNVVTRILEPGSEPFAAVEKLAHEYGEMCAARALEGTEVDVQLGLAGGFDGIVSMVNGRLVVRPK